MRINGVDLTEDILARFWPKVDKKGDNECWEWRASLTNTGYGLLAINKRMRLAHRVSYTIANGEILNSLHVLHSCDNPKCVNPNHLSLGTHQENMKEMSARHRTWQQRREFCPQGHPYSGENLYINKLGRRECRICIRVKQNKRTSDKSKSNGSVPHKNRTHCPQGHGYTLENTYSRPTGGRTCRTCHAERNRRYNEKKQLESKPKI